MIYKVAQKYSVIDLETTGANRDGQKITEIAIINFDGKKIESTFSSLVNPERYISYQIQQLTGITNEMVQTAPKFYQLAKEIVERTEGRVIVAHNVFFDYRFLQREFRELGFLFKREVYCTCKMARLTFPGLMSYSLKNLSQHFNHQQLNPHRALSDAEDCLNLFTLIQSSPSDSAHSFSPPDVDHLIPSQLKNFSFKNYPESPGLYFMYDAKGALLYVGKSQNVRNRLKQHFKIFYGQKREQELKQQVSEVTFLETFHSIPTSMLELHFIKSLKPRYNRASRKTRFRFSLVPNPTTDHLGEEIKVSTLLCDSSPYYHFGSKKSAYYEKAKIYTEAFGLNLFAPDFTKQLAFFKKNLGEDQYVKKLIASYQKRDINLMDRRIEGIEWSLSIKENILKEITIGRHLPDNQKIEISESPDMRHILLAILKKGRYL